MINAFDDNIQTSDISSILRLTHLYCKYVLWIIYGSRYPKCSWKSILKVEGLEFLIVMMVIDKDNIGIIKIYCRLGLTIISI